jgi:hypothetical protein
MILLHICLAMGVAVCALLSGLFYATPGLGYCEEYGILYCFCRIIAMTEPHFSFMLCVVSGLLALSLCERVGGEVVSLGLVLLFHVCLSGIFSFDIVNYSDTHSVFLTGLIIVSLVFSLLVLDWENVWNKAGAVVYLSLSGIFIAVPAVLWVLSFDRYSAINIINHVQLAWIVSMVFMFGAFVYS